MQMQMMDWASRAGHVCYPINLSIHRSIHRIDPSIVSILLQYLLSIYRSHRIYRSIWGLEARVVVVRARVCEHVERGLVMGQG